LPLPCSAYGDSDLLTHILRAVSSWYYRDPDAPLPNQPRRVAVTAIIEDKGRVLLDRRADAPFWGLIGGHLEDDESLLEGLRREVREETGLQIRSASLFGTFSDPSRRVHYADGRIYPVLSVAYLVQVDDPSNLQRSDESSELSFFPKDRLPRDIIATQLPIIERYLSGETPPFLD
jgi:ADP-ribose pyrophosphatase YjhB (NUDIX family)